MAFELLSDRRAASGDHLAAAMLDAQGPLHFDDLLNAASGAEAGEVAGWLGHAVHEGLVVDMGGGQYRLRARGKRLFSARRRRLKGERSGPSVPPA